MAYTPRGVQGAFQGLGEGISSGADDIIKYLLNRQQVEGTRNDQLVKDFGDRVSRGELAPEQADAAMQSRGVQTAPGFFHALAPSVSQRMAGAMSSIDNAKNPGDVPSLPRLRAVAQAGGIPTDNPADVAATSGPSAQGPRRLSPELEQLSDERENRLNSFPPVMVEHFSPTAGTNIRESIPARDFTSEHPFQFQLGPTAEQAGDIEGRKTAAQKAAEISGNVPQMTATEKNIESDLTLGSTAKTAGAVASASEQARLGVQNSPTNVQGDAQREAAIAGAKKRAEDEAAAAGVPPEIGRSFMHTTATGLPYFFAPTGTPKEYVQRGIDAATRAIPGIRILDRQQNDAIQQLDVARDNLKSIMQQFGDALPKSADGRVLVGPKNTFDVWAQRNPALAAAKSTSFANMIEGFRAMTAGVTGFRMTQNELTKAADAWPKPTDTYDVAYKKVNDMFETFSHIEKRMLGIEAMPPEEKPR